MTTVSLARATRTWAWIAANSFGGPAAQIAVMHRVVVEEERWVDEEQFLAATQLVMLLPGPEAQQLATWLGWRMHGVRGGLVAGALFVVPGFLALLAISLAYVLLPALPHAAGAGLGLKAAVLGVVVEAVVRFAKRGLGDRRRAAIAIGAFVALFALQIPFPVVVAVAGALGLAGFVRGAPIADLGAAPSLRSTLATAAAWAGVWLAPLAALAVALGPDARLVQIGGLFATGAAVSFGGAYAVLAWVAQQAVDARGWLSPGEMLDGLAFAETTPGPLIQVVQFVAFLAAWRAPGAWSPLGAALAASALATWVTYAPSFLWIFTLAPWLSWVRAQAPLRGALAAITAAVVGVIANLAAWSAMHLCLGPGGAFAAVLAGASVVALVAGRAPMLAVLAAGAAIGALFAPV